MKVCVILKLIKRRLSMLSLLNSVDGTLKTFFNQLTDALGYGGYLGLVLGVEAFFVILFIVATAFSYEARLKRSLDRCNKWLFKNKKIDMGNIKDFNKTIKKGPKRLVYYWQQFILYREGGPSAYLTEENIINKPLKTSSWQSNIRNLGLVTAVWSVVALILGIASQTVQTFGFESICVALVLPCLTALLGIIGIILLKGRRVMNLDDIYHIHHFFVRFMSSATADLTPYIDFNLLFTEKEIENGNPQLREYYEARARKTKEEFEKAQQNDVPLQSYQFENVGVDGALLLDRAMKESEIYIGKKNSILSQIAQIESQKDALKRNYENVQMDLQRKIQASKENIEKLIEQQASTTSRIEIGLLKNQQQKEVNKRAQLQKDYDQEEQRYLQSKGELEADVDELKKQLDESLDEVQKAMGSEYQTFFEKVMKSAYAIADQKVKDEKRDLTTERDKNEQELVIVQTQIKRLKDENDTLRDRLSKFDENYKENQPQDEQGHYDEQGNYIYNDGSYHDTNGLFHDVDGKVYNMNGELVSYDVSPEEQAVLDQEEIKNQQIQNFGSYVEDGEKASDGQEEAQHEEQQATEEPEEQYDSQEVEEQPQEEQSTESYDSEPTSEEGAESEEPTEEPTEEVSVEEPLEEAPVEETAQTEEAPAEEENAVIEVPESETIEETVEEEPKKKRGRPRKTESQESVNEPAKKRGRPRKTVAEEPATSTPARKRGRPRKTENVVIEENVITKTAPKRSPSKKTSTKKTATSKSKPASATKPKTTSKAKSTKTSSTTKPKSTAKPKTTAKPKSTSQTVKTSTAKRGRPRKATSTSTEENKPSSVRRVLPRTEELDGDLLTKINELINKEESKLQNIKAFFNNEIDEALEPKEQNYINQEKDDIMNAVESLKEQADKAKSSGQSEELSKINKRIEDLIKELSNINSEGDTNSDANA